MSASDPPSDRVPAGNAWPEMSAEEEDELRQAFAEAEESQRRGDLIPHEELLARLRDREPIALDPGEEEELDRRSREANDLDARGLLPSGEDHIRRLRAGLEQRRAG